MNNLQIRTTWYRIFIIFLASALSIVIYNNASAVNNTDAIIVKVNAGDEGISVNVKSSKSCELQFYIFNVEGQLVKQYAIKNNTLLKVASLSRGIYLYDVFHKDARLKSGKIELK